MTLYHATVAENIEGIEANGLLPFQTEAAQRIFEGPGVWCFAALSDATSFAASNWTPYDDVVIYAIEADGLAMIADPEYAEGVAYIITEEIPADRLTVAWDNLGE